MKRKVKIKIMFRKKGVKHAMKQVAGYDNLFGATKKEKKVGILGGWV